MRRQDTMSLRTLASLSALKAVCVMCLHVYTALADELWLPCEMGLVSIPEIAHKSVIGSHIDSCFTAPRKLILLTP